MVAPGFFELLVVVANAVLAFGALATLLAAVLLKLGGAASTSASAIAVAVFVNLSAVTVATTRVLCAAEALCRVLVAVGAIAAEGFEAAALGVASAECRDLFAGAVGFLDGLAVLFDAVEAAVLGRAAPLALVVEDASAFTRDRRRVLGDARS